LPSADSATEMPCWASGGDERRHHEGGNLKIVAAVHAFDVHGGVELPAGCR